MATSISTGTPIQPDFQQLWNTIEIRPEWKNKIRNAANFTLQYEDTYRKLALIFNPQIPWYFIACIHYMEGGCNFHTHLHNGDPLTNRTVHEPKGRPLLPPVNGAGQPYTWKESAMDALRMKGYDKMQVWDIAHILQRLEAYNGTGYRRRGIYTPYLWSGTNHYTAGKYIADGHFSADTVSKQVGAAPLLKQLIAAQHAEGAT